MGPCDNTCYRSRARVAVGIHSSHHSGVVTSHRAGWPREVLQMRAAGSGLLVGSIPLNSAGDVFRATAALAGRVKRFPDGETGVRSDWIVWQYPVLNAGPK